MTDERTPADWETDRLEPIPFSNPDKDLHPRRVLTGTAPAARVIDASGTLITKVDEDASTEDVYYIGKAIGGGATSAAIWQIKRITVTDTGSPSKLSVDVDFADGDTRFDNIYDDRESLSYS